MNRFLLDKNSTAEAVSQPDTCPLCRIWSVYVTGLAQARDGKQVQSFDREQAHSFLIAGYWAGVQATEEPGQLVLCKTHQAHVAQIDALNSLTTPAEEGDPA